MPGFSLTYVLRNPDPATISNEALSQGYLEQMASAEQLGYDGVFFAESHGGAMPRRDADRPMCSEEQRAMKFNERIAKGLVVAPYVSSPLAAKLAEAAGFPALYLGGGGIGFEKCVTEANLNAHDFATLALDIRAVSQLPLIMDATAGFGDPMHMVRTIGVAEAAGFAAIELEDVALPKRAHHHVGVDHPIPAELMVQKLREAAAARNTDMMIIARTGVTKVTLDEAMRRAEMYLSAGADMLWLQTLDPDQLRQIGERFPPPLMHVVGPGSFHGMGISQQELEALGYRLLVDASTPLLAVHRALREAYGAIAAASADPLLGENPMEEHMEMLRTVDIERLLEIERRTVGA